ncbi:S-type pyocin domain-containing protein [Rosenbergiella nectarea]|uniref:S-type pyocin domain-containing protein n=1 Tax=Rosenbergiella nectarea TaxID=988801 RepID=UPI001F4FFEB0|nr:S-type pyocin domain-containing protein [Rosenbergiella nectarea]
MFSRSTLFLMCCFIPCRFELGLVGGSAITSGTWAVKLGEIVTGLGRIAASGPGAPIAVLVMGMMPGRLNDGEQDYVDRMRLEQMRDAPTRVRYSWEQDDKGNLVPRGWHTPPGKDRVRVRKMAWDKLIRLASIAYKELCIFTRCE